MQRRHFLALTAATTLTTFSATPSLALNESSAKRLVNGLVGEINRVIASGKSANAMYSDFERILGRYGDMATIAQSTLGADGRNAPAATKRAYKKALQGYIARKYGKRFREFIGGEIEVRGVKRVKRYYEVNAVAKLRGQSPFALDFMVSDRSGKELFFDMKIEGVSLLLTERREIGALLDRKRGDIAALTADLKKMG
ncbi:MlaC/ttg2D family ABC transporter substrate-binding protein [Primorskyibacter sp. S187A]|uniref:MlaC/ttg2D family ABC transporter substrate-binding protein n=1 Tax=Primorskyibacter sp. S187A TaxID=3415130 RepID=UPI003C7C33EE